jgi:poly-gamma-glutamate synthesis protein (capsule biosynthesis protein)
VLDYQVEIAHAAIDVGAGVVMGHGPHDACAAEMYQGRPISGRETLDGSIQMD